MNPKRIELLVFVILFFSLMARLFYLNWVEPLIWLSYITWISIWVYGYFKQKKFGIHGYRLGEALDRVFFSFLVLGLAINITEHPFSPMLISFSLLLLLAYFLIKGIVKLAKKDIVVGLESLVISFILMGYFFRIMQYPGSGIFKVVFSTLLSQGYVILAIYFGIKLLKNKVTLAGITGTILFLALSVLLTSILFRTMFWPGSTQLYYVGLLVSVIVLPIYIYGLIQKKRVSPDIRNLTGFLTKRAFQVILISTFFSFIPNSEYVRLQFGNRKQLIEAYCGCRLSNNNNILYSQAKEQSCRDFEVYEIMLRHGYYREGISDEELQNQVQNFRADYNDKIEYFD